MRLVPLSSQPLTLLPRPVLLSCLHSFVFRARARERMHMRPDLRNFGPPSGGVCVCVRPLKSQGSFWNALLAFLFFTSVDSRGARDRASLALTKTLALVCDIAPGRWSVPALRRTYVSAKLSHSLLRSKRLTQR